MVSVSRHYTVPDPRYHFFLAQLEGILGVPASETLLTDLQPVERFLDDASCTTVFATHARPEHKDGSEMLIFSNECTELLNHLHSSAASSVLFIKLSSCILENDDMVRSMVTLFVVPEGVNVLSVFGASVKSVFAPVLLGTVGMDVHSSGNMPLLNEKAKGLLFELERSISATPARVVVSGSENVNEFSNICTPLDELQFWEGFRGGSIDPVSAEICRENMRDIVEAFHINTAAEVSGRLSIEDQVSLDLSLTSTFGKLDASFGEGGVIECALANIYRVNLRDADPFYSIERMTNTIGVVSSAFCQLIRQSLPAHPGLFVGPFSLVKSFLRAATQLLESYYGMIKKLTEIDFRALPENPWCGPSYRNCFLENFLDRLRDILDVRTAYEELRSILSEQICDELTNFKPFMSYDPLLWSPYTKERFERSRNTFNASLVPLERSVVSEIKRRIEPLVNRGAAELVKFLSQYHVLLKRPNIAGEMSAVVEKLNQSLIEVVDRMEEVIDDLDVGEDHIEAITLCRQCDHKARQIESYASGLNLDPDVVALFGVLVSRCKQTQQKIFEEWIERFESVHMPVLTGKLIEIDKNGFLQVTFEESLIVLLSQARQLVEYGLPVPASIKTQMKGEGEKMFRFGVVLKKVTNFYNSLEDLIIPEQRAMLLEPLIAFEKLLKDGYPSSSASAKRSVSWRGVDDSELFVEKLHRQAEKLRDEINHLRRLHVKLADLSSSLSNIDLLTEKTLWQQGWAEIERLIDNVSKRYSRKHMSKWVRYWNKEIYCVLNGSYKSGLKRVSTKLGEYKCSLRMKNGELAFSPPLSALRAKQKSKIKSFIEFPGTKFIGFGASDLFSQIPQKNCDLVDGVYKSADALFDSVDTLRLLYSNWSSLGDDIKADGCSLGDFEGTFRLLEQRSNDVALIPDVKRIGCVKVTLFDLKGLLTTKLQDLHDAVVVCLRNNVLALTTKVDEFLLSSVAALERTPSSPKEFRAVQAQWRTIENEKQSMLDSSLEIEQQKELLLKKKCFSAELDVDKINSNAVTLGDSRESIWTTLDEKLRSFSDLLDQQKDSVAKLLQIDVTKLNNQVDSLKSRFNTAKPADSEDFCLGAIIRVSETLGGVEDEFSKLKHDANELNSQCAAFSVCGPQLDEINSIGRDLEKTIESFAFLKSYLREREELTRQNWIEFRANIFVLEEFLIKWSKLSKEQQGGCGLDNAVLVLEKDLDCIHNSMETLKLCRGDAFREDHWSELLQGKLKLSKTLRVENLTCGHFLSVIDKLSNPDIFHFVTDLQSRAQGEVIIREGIQELNSWAHEAELETTIYQCNGCLTALIKNWRDMLIELGNKQSLLGTLKGSPFFKRFSDTGIIYDNKFAKLDTILRLLNQIQRKWLYLKPIFSRGSLKSEENRFNRVDNDFCRIMGVVGKDSKLFHFVDKNIHHDLEKRCQVMLDQLNRCQRALFSFLEQKRSIMPRFYFVGDDDLLEIIGQGSNVSIMQAHFKKLFQATAHVEINKKSSTLIEAFGSQEGESVALVKSVEITNDAENWLSQLIAGTKFTLDYLLMSCLEEDDHPQPTNYWDKYPGQVLGLAASIRFSSEVTIAFDAANGLSMLKQKLALSLRGNTCCIKKLSSLVALKMKGVVLDLIHHRDIVDQLLTNQTTSENNWIWQKQLRYTYKERLCSVQMGLATFNYSFEYQGNQPKLVYTSLTDRCFLTLTQALHFGFGGNPYGPAGTGKTESVKALGASLGRQVLVFNCDEGIDYAGIGRIFVGLIKSGSWGCFDEFNRLRVDQLSAISEQIRVIQAAIKNKTGSIQLLGHDINVDFNSAIFVTLNPAGKAYGGRSQLPENLKTLFRPISMGKPDNITIADVYLLAEGFTASTMLAQKVSTIFDMSQQIFTGQKHYDWGLRALKAVLHTAGKILSVENSNAEASEMSLDEESKIILQAIHVNTISKLASADIARFLGLLQDAFPGISIGDINSGEIERAVRKVITEEPFLLDNEESLVEKVLQLKAALENRIGCVILAHPCSGKSTIWKILQYSLRLCGETVSTFVMNPKALTRHQLLGCIDLDTNEWTDGVLTHAAREASKEAAEVHSWIICDGDVDPEWIESLNSLLDDNRLLTLPNGERITFGVNVNFIFETHDLSYASPATISRMGIIHLGDNLPIKNILNHWIRTYGPALHTNIHCWIDAYFFRAMDIINTLNFMVPVNTAIVAMNGLNNLIESGNEVDFLLRLSVGLGAYLSSLDRTSFCDEVCGWSSENLNLLMNTESPFPTAQLLPTTNVNRSICLILECVKKSEAFLISGPRGSGKETLVRHAFSVCGHTNVVTLHCSANTSAFDVKSKIEQNCALFAAPDGRAFRPSNGESLAIYLKDINIASVDRYGTSSLVEFLLQIISYGGFYYNDSEFIRLERIQMVASISGDLNESKVSPRLFSNMKLVILDAPTDQELSEMCHHFLDQVKSLGGDHKSTNTMRSALAKYFINVFHGMKHGVVTCSPYQHTPYALKTWVDGLRRFDLSKNDAFECAAYAAERQFRDCITNGSDQSIFDQVLRSAGQIQWEPGQSHFTTCHWNGVEDGEKYSAAPSLLQKVEQDEYKDILRRGLKHKRDNYDYFLLFSDALCNVSKIEYIFANPGGHALLAGNRGIGKRTSVKFLCDIHQIEFFCLRPTRAYNLTDFHCDLREVLKIAGIEDSRACLFIEEHILLDDATIWDSLNSIISSGEDPILFAQEDLTAFLSPLNEEYLNDGGHASLYEFYLSRIRNNLHIFVSINSVLDADEPSHNLDLYPGISKYAQFIWMGGLSEDAMREICIMKKDDLPLLSDNVSSNEKEKVKERDDRVDLVDFTIHVQRSVPWASPYGFYKLLSTWEMLYLMKQKKLQNDLRTLWNGLEKVNTASIAVKQLGEDSDKQQFQLNIAQQKADEAMDAITIALSDAKERKKEMENLRIQLEQQTKETVERKALIESELSEVQPILDSAKDAVGSIKSQNLTEIRSMKTPPAAISDVLSAVLMLFGHHDLSWISMKKFLGSRGIKQEILNFDARKIKSRTRTEVTKFIASREISFDAASIRRASVAAAPLARWVQANLKYSSVLETIQPKQEELSAAEQTLQKSQVKLDNCWKELEIIDRKVFVLKEDFGKKTRETELLKDQLSIAKQRLNRSQILVELLSDEHRRWEERVMKLQENVKSLPVDTLLASGFAVYLCMTGEEKRKEYVAKWLGIFKYMSNSKKSFCFKQSMGSGRELITWKKWNLPSDILSLENALAFKFVTNQVPFIIDPGEVSMLWIRSYLESEYSQKLEVVSSNDLRLINEVELSVRFGKLLVITDVTTLEPYFYPLVQRDVLREGSRLIVQLGKKKVDFNEAFRIFFVSKSQNINLSTSAKNFVTEINFTVSESGLDDQFLSTIMLHEAPELEALKSSAIKQEQKLNVELSELENNLLIVLSEADGDLLGNETIVDTLKCTKESASKINKTWLESKSTNEELDKQRHVYKQLSASGSKLYFLLSQLQTLNSMYQFSVKMFIRLFKQTLQDPENLADNKHDRLMKMKASLYRRVFYAIGRCMFKDDIPVFALALVKNMNGELCSQNEWNFLLGKSAERNHSALNAPSWADSAQKRSLNILGMVCSDLVGSIDFSCEEWSNWGTEMECELHFPAMTHVSAFRRLLIIRALRPDRLLPAISEFCRIELDVASLSPEPIKLADLWELHKAEHTFLLIATPGTDPSNDLKDLAEKEVGLHRFQRLSLGGGKQDNAIALLRRAAREGCWLCLENLHLVSNWSVVLEKEMSQLGDDIHPTFSLWLTTEPSENISHDLIRNSLKVVYESPTGIKYNVQRIVAHWGSNFVREDISDKARSQLLFLLAWFHALVNERNKFFRQGWAEHYGFSVGDILAGSFVMENCYRTKNWDAIHGLLIDSIYGGRINNVYDQQILTVYVKEIFCSAVLDGYANIPMNSKIKVPKKNCASLYKELLSTLPSADYIHIFGLPKNVGHYVSSAASATLVDKLMTLENSSHSTKFDSQVLRDTLSSTVQLWEELKESFPKVSASEESVQTPKKSFNCHEFEDDMNSGSIVDSCIKSEAAYGRYIFRAINSKLTSVLWMLKSDELLQPQLSPTLGMISKGLVPNEWISLWPGGPDNLSDWLDDVIQRTNAMLDLAQRENPLEAVISLSMFFNPLTFLNALRQQTARLTNSAIDNLRLVCQWNREHISSSSLCVTIDDVLIQGSYFNGHSLAEVASNAKDLAAMPPLILVYVTEEDKAAYLHPHNLYLPLYFDTSREKVLTELSLPCANAEEIRKWILSGTALFMRK